MIGEVTNITNNIMSGVSQPSSTGDSDSLTTQFLAMIGNILANVLEGGQNGNQNGQGAGGSATPGAGGSATSGAGSTAGPTVASAHGDLAKDAGGLLSGGIDQAMRDFATNDAPGLANFKADLDAGNTNTAVKDLTAEVNNGKLSKDEGAEIAQGLVYTSEQHGGRDDVTNDNRNALAQAVGSDVLPR